MTETDTRTPRERMEDENEEGVAQELREARPRAGTGVQGRRVISDFERDVKGYYKDASDEQVICDTYGHSFPELIPGEDVPPGVWASPGQERGLIELTETCRRCGEIRHSVLARGFLAQRAQRRYKRPKNTRKRPEGYYGSRADAQWELIRRVGVRTVLKGGGS